MGALGPPTRSGRLTRPSAARLALARGAAAAAKARYLGPSL